MLAVTILAVTTNPVLKAVGLLPADVFRSLGIFFPGEPQIVFGPLMAFSSYGPRTTVYDCFNRERSRRVGPINGFHRRRT